MRSTSCTPSSTSSRRWSNCRLPPTAPSTVRSAPVDRCTSNPISTSCAITFCTCSSVARSCITTTISVPFFISGLRFALQAPRLVYHSLEQALHRLVVQRSRVDLLHVRQDFGLARWLIDLQAQQLLLASDLERAGRAGAERPHEQFVEVIDPPPEIRQHRFCRRRIRFHSSLFSHATYFSTRPARSGSPA